jgi:hypothetical protein
MSPLRGKEIKSQLVNRVFVREKLRVERDLGGEGGAPAMGEE